MRLTPAEFEEVMERIHGKLSAEEQEVLESVIEGAEVNHSVFYVLGAFVLGGLAGAAVTLLFL